MCDESAALKALKCLIQRTDKTCDAQRVSELLIKSNGGAARAFELAAEDITALTGLNKTAAQAIDLSDELARYALIENLGANPRLDTLERQGEFFAAMCMGRHVEHCYLASLDKSKRLIGCKLLARGSLSEAEVHVRSIAQTAQRSGASYALVSHNHPGGALKPSDADIELTRLAIKALKIIDCELIEHVIVAPGGHMGIISGGYV